MSVSSTLYMTSVSIHFIITQMFWDETIANIWKLLRKFQSKCIVYFSRNFCKQSLIWRPVWRPLCLISSKLILAIRSNRIRSAYQFNATLYWIPFKVFYYKNLPGWRPLSRHFWNRHHLQVCQLFESILHFFEQT